MSWEFVRKEWGAVSFVATVLIGLIVVPIALYFAHQSPTSPTTVTSAARTASPARSVSPTP